MAKKKKKKSQAFTMIVLFLVIIVLLIGYFVAKGIAEKSEKDKSESGDTKLIQIDTSKAKTLTYLIDGEEYTLIKEDDIWKVESEKERPLDQDKVQDMVDRFKEMTASKVVSENQDKLADLRLDKPALTVTLKLEDGATYSYSTGTNVVTSDGGCYAIVQGYPGIYILPEGYYSLFSANLNTITKLAVVSDVNANNVTKIRITKDGKVMIDAAQDKDTETWGITKPYALGVKMDSNNMNNLASNYVSYRFLENIDYNCKDFSQYGLDKPTSEVYLEYFTKDSDDSKTTDHTLKLSIGKTNEDGSLYYVRLNDSESVYTMGVNTIDLYTNVNAFDYVDYSLFNKSISAFSKLNISAEGKTYDIQMLKDSYKINGVEKSASDIGTIYGKLTLVKIKEEAEKEVSTNNPRCTISLTDTDNTVSNYSFLEYDANYYAMHHEGFTYFLVDKRSIDDLIHTLENL